MKVICGWCKKIIRDDENAKPEDPVSHGICPACFKEMLKDCEKIKEHNESLRSKVNDKRKDKRGY